MPVPISETIINRKNQSEITASWLDDNLGYEGGYGTNFWFVFENGNYGIWSSASSGITRFTYMPDIISQKVDIALYVTDSYKFEIEKDILMNRWYVLSLGSGQNSELCNISFTLKTQSIPFLSIGGWLPKLNLTTDAQIIETSECFAQNGFKLDAPNLRELIIDIETSKIMELSPQTKPKVITTVGKEGYIFDPREYESDD